MAGWGLEGAAAGPAPSVGGAAAGAEKHGGCGGGGLRPILGARGVTRGGAGPAIRSHARSALAHEHPPLALAVVGGAVAPYSMPLLEYGWLGSAYSKPLLE